MDQHRDYLLQFDKDLANAMPKERREAFIADISFLIELAFETMAPRSVMMFRSGVIVLCDKSNRFGRACYFAELARILDGRTFLEFQAMLEDFRKTGTEKERAILQSLPDDFPA